MERYYQIADLTVRMDTFGRTERQAESYRCPAVTQPDICVRGNWETVQEAAPHLDRDTAEYLGTGGSFYSQLLRHGGMMLHASAVILDGWAYLFTAPSGTGKSTHTQLWLRQFGSRARILNDDKPALRQVDGVWYAYGTPWSGKTDWNLPQRAPLAGICILTRGEENRIRQIPGNAAVGFLLSQTLRPPKKEPAGTLLELMDALLTAVPMWKLECNMEPQAARISYEAMSAGRKEMGL